MVRLKKFFERYRTVIILAIILVGVFAATRWMDFFSVRSGTRIGYVGKESRSSWSGSYISLDGMMKKSIYPKGDVLHVEVNTESGTISMEITDTHGNILFEKDNIETSSFDVEVSGKVKIRIEADHHKGSFDIGG